MQSAKEWIGRLLPAIVAALLALMGATVMLGGYQAKVEQNADDIQNIEHVDLPALQARISALESSLASLNTALDAHNELHKKFEEDVKEVKELLRDTQKELSQLNRRGQ